MSVKRIVRGLRRLLLPHSDVHTWDDGEVAVEVFGERGRGFLLLCEPGGSALCVVTVNNVARRTRYVNGAENLGHWGGVIVANLYYARDRRERPSARAFAWPATERFLIDFRHHSLNASTIEGWSLPLAVDVSKSSDRTGTPLPPGAARRSAL